MYQFQLWQHSFPLVTRQSQENLVSERGFVPIRPEWHLIMLLWSNLQVALP